MHLAQLNIGVATEPMENPSMVGFTGNIDRINALADRFEGFVWRLTDETSDTDGALDLRLPGDANMLVNMSVWESVESLYRFVYQTAHAKIMRDREQWFVPMTEQYMVLWWVEEGHIPDLEEAKEKLDLLRKNGPTPAAFSFTVPFDENGNPISPPMGRKDCA